MTDARRHLIYYYFLTECCLLSERNRRAVEKVWGESEGELIRSVPSEVARAVIMPALSDAFDYDLHGVPGFFFDWRKEMPCHWQINLPTSYGLLKPYWAARGRILGLYLYRSAIDTRPRLLTSAGLRLGSPALQPQELLAA